MRKANVYRNGKLVGFLTQLSTNDYQFRYDDNWFTNGGLPPISLTMPKNKKVYKSEYLFPFFFNMLSEGVNRQLQTRHLKIDEKDYFGLLLATARTDTIGAITISEIKE
ncbi:MAG: HipA N-terminal domain-containing protein [Mariniphaga sp.]|nr:HipA N-terminal domain-containing protein [Mariniphaga sp.]